MGRWNNDHSYPCWNLMNSWNEESNNRYFWASGATLRIYMWWYSAHLNWEAGTIKYVCPFILHTEPENDNNWFGQHTNSILIKLPKCTTTILISKRHSSQRFICDQCRFGSWNCASSGLGVFSGGRSRNLCRVGRTLWQAKLGWGGCIQFIFHDFHSEAQIWTSNCANDAAAVPIGTLLPTPWRHWCQYALLHDAEYGPGCEYIQNELTYKCIAYLWDWGTNPAQALPRHTTMMTDCLITQKRSDILLELLAPDNSWTVNTDECASSRVYHHAWHAW